MAICKQRATGRGSRSGGMGGYKETVGKGGEGGGQSTSDNRLLRFVVIVNYDMYVT